MSKGKRISGSAKEKGGVIDIEDSIINGEHGYKCTCGYERVVGIRKKGEEIWELHHVGSQRALKFLTIDIWRKVVDYHKGRYGYEACAIIMNRHTSKYHYADIDEIQKHIDTAENGVKISNKQIDQALDVIKRELGFDNINYISGESIIRALNVDGTPHIPDETEEPDMWSSRLYFPRYITESIIAQDRNICMFCNKPCSFRYSKVMLIHEEKIGDNEIVQHTYMCGQCRISYSDPGPGEYIIYNGKQWFINEFNRIITGRCFKPKFIHLTDSYFVDGDEDNKCMFCGEWCAGSRRSSRYHRFELSDVPTEERECVHVCDGCYDLYQFYELNKEELDQLAKIKDKVIMNGKAYMLDYFERVNS